MGIDHRGDRVSGVVKTVDGLKTERNQQRQPQQKKGQVAGHRHIGLFHVIDQVQSGKGQASDQQKKKQRFAEAAVFAAEVGSAPGR